MKDKLWKDCSKEEHNAINRWNHKRRTVLKQYKNGSITKEQFKLANILLYEWLRLIEEKYKEED